MKIVLAAIATLEVSFSRLLVQHRGQGEQGFSKDSHHTEEDERGEARVVEAFYTDLVLRGLL